MEKNQKNVLINRGFDTFENVVKSKNFNKNPNQTYTLLLIIMFGITLIGVFFIAYYVLVDLNYSVINLNNSVIQLTDTLKELIRK